MKFNYKALLNNKVVQKQIEAHSEHDVVAYLRKNNYIPINISPVRSIIPEFDSVFNKPNFNDIVDFTRQLAIMLNAGLTLVDCFIILQKQIKKKSILTLVLAINKEIMAGNKLSEALQKYPDYFPNIYIALVKSGEASGKLSDILLKLADNLEKQRDFQAKIKGALTYPAIVVIGMLGVMFVMITFVIPKLLTLYKDFNVELPMTTKLLILVSDFFSKFWPFILLGVFAGVTALQRYIKTPVGKHQLDKLLLGLPVIGNIVRISALVDSTRTLSILISSGVSILETLSIIIETTTNSIFKASFKTIYKQVEKGVSFGTALNNEQVFPPILIQMATVGEQTGHLDETMGRISRYFEMESEMAVKSMTTLIEPLILVVLGVGVGFLVISVITPIYNLTSSFK